jgi:hypothetical protein
VFGQIEAIHRAGQIQIAVGIEDAREALGLRFQITLDRKMRRERTDRVRVAGDRIAAEALEPLAGGAIRDGAELARDAHAAARWMIGRVLATLPIRIAQDRLALH